MIVGLMLFAGGLGMALGIVLTIEHNGRTTTVEVPDGSKVTVGKNGAVGVKVPAAGNTDKEAVPATSTVDGAAKSATHAKEAKGAAADGANPFD